MADPIIIISANETTGELTLNHSDTVFVGRFEKVVWSIQAPNVDSFIIKPKNNSEQIFVFFDHPPSRPTTNGGGRVSPFAPRGAIFEYSIHWTDKNGNPHTHDPIIAVRPKTFIEILIILGVILFTAVLRFSIRKFFRR